MTENYEVNENVENETVKEETVSASQDTLSSDNKPKTPREGWPIWVTLLSVFLAIVITFFSTFAIITDQYGTALDRYMAQKAEGASELYGAIDLVEYVNKLFGANYIYKVDYDKMAKAMLDAYAKASGDKYAYYFTPEEWASEMQSTSGNSVGLGVYVVPESKDPNAGTISSLLITHVMKDSGAYNAGIKAGDRIVGIEETSLDGLVYQEALNLVVGEVGQSIKVVIERNGQQMNLIVVRCKFAAETVLTEIIEKDGTKIGYIRLIEFAQTTGDQFKSAFQSLKKSGCESFIFDVRDNGGGYLTAIVSVLDYLLPEGPIVHLITKTEETETVNSDASYQAINSAVVLCNNRTASAAELFTSALKDYKYATVIGNLTYGKGCGQTTYGLSNGGAFKLTSFLYTPPYSDNYDGIGVYPDITVDINEEYQNANLFLIDKNKDTQIQAAIDYILTKNN